MTITLSAFAQSPDRGRGLARDMGVRWALEETGQQYDVRLLSFAAMKEPPHLALNPFGQIPTFQEGETRLFESGAIILHIATHHEGLLPADPPARARAILWMFAALSTIEPPIVERSFATMFDRDAPWFDERMRAIEDRIAQRLGVLARYLGDADWLEDAFSAGDLVMITVLRRLAGSTVLADHPAIAAYIARGEQRPAFARAFDAQLAVFNNASATTPDA